MIYFDNAATSKPKPEEVYDALIYYLREIGTSPGRGSYGLAIQASRMLYQSRKTVVTFFGAQDPANVVFTKNSTEAINLFFNGFLQDGDHVIISPYEHNAVLRPLETLKRKGRIDYTVLPEQVLYDPTEIKKYVLENTRLLAVTLASNLTGQVVFSKELAESVKQLGLFVFVDSSQGAGKKLVDMQRDSIDFLAFTGHKDLLGVPGTGGFVSVNPIHIPPLIQGGTGIHGESYINPDAFPDSYEAGTLNMPAIWALKTGIEYINQNINSIAAREIELLSYLMEKLQQIPGITVYNPDKKRVPTICFNVIGRSSSDVVEHLSKHDICVRGGIHCAILAHETIHTVKTGAVRISLNHYNTEKEIDKFIEVIGALV